MGEEQAHRAHSGEPVRRHPHGRRQAIRLPAGDRRHDRAGEGDHLPDRRQADASGARAAGAARQEARGRLRQSYARVGKLALIKHQRYAHAKQFKRANRALRSLRTMLGRVIRDITRKIAAGRSSPRSSPGRSRSPAASRTSASASAAGRSIQPACARGGMHRQRQGAQALRVRRQGERRHTRSSAARAASSSPM